MILRRRPAHRPEPSQSPPRLVLPAGVVPTWLAGEFQVQVAGETFHAAAITAATRAAGPSGTLTAVLVPETDNPHDEHAVAVYLDSHLAGHLPRDVAVHAHPALLSHAARRGGPVSCPAQVRLQDVGPQVILYLDAAALSISPSLLEHLPELAQVIQRLLPRLDEPTPSLSGTDPKARAALAQAVQARDDVEADYDRSPGAWQQVEREFRRIATQLEHARDPRVSEAWLGVAQSVRYQRGRRDDFLAAVIEALHWDDANTDAWVALVDYASAAPHVPTFLAIFSRVPAAARPPVLNRLVIAAHGRDRLGNMNSEAGLRLVDELLSFARSEGDTTTAATLSRRRNGAQPGARYAKRR